MTDVAFANPPLLQSLNNEDEDRVLVSLTGAAQVSEDIITASSASATSNNPGTTKFTITAPGYAAILDRKVLLQATVVVTATAGANESFVVTAAPVPVSYPLNNAIESIQVKTNNQTLTFQPRHYKGYWERMTGPQDKHSRFNSMTPTMRDNDLSLAKMATFSTIGGAIVPVRAGPFNPISTQDPYRDSRAAFPVEFTPGAGITKTFGYSFTEPLLMDLFEALDDQEGLYNIDQMEITINWSQNAFALMFSNPSNTIAPLIESTQAATAPVQSSVSFTAGTQKLLLRWLTPSVDLRDTLTIPANFYDRTSSPLVNVPTSGTDGVAGTSVQVTTNLKITQVVPRFIIIGFRRDQLPLADENCDYWCRILSLQLKIGNVPSLLSNATPQQLWKMSVNNGLNVSFDEWYNRGQCFVVLQVGVDIGGIVPGMISQFQISISATIQNLTDQALIPNGELYLVTDGFMEFSPGNLRLTEGLSADKISDGIMGGVEAVNQKDQLMNGGSFKSVFKKISKVFGKAMRKGSEVAGAYGKMTGNPYALGASKAMGGLSDLHRAAGGGMKLLH